MTTARAEPDSPRRAEPTTNPAPDGASSEEAAAGTPAARPIWHAPLLVVGAAIAGIAVARFAVVPRLLGHTTAEAPAAESTEHAESPPGRLFRIDNIVVNPSGSQGTRFLMAAVVIEVDNEAAEARLREREVQVRDMVTAVFESRTMEMLTTPGARDSLKRRLADTVTPLLPPRTSIKVYLPQYVIQ